MLALAAGAGLTGCSQQAETVSAKPDGLIAVQVIEVRTEEVRRKVEIVGALAGLQETTLSSEVSGRVVRIHADLGDRVRTGEVLVEIDPTQYQLAVDRQSAALNEALAQLGMKSAEAALPDVTETSIVRRAAADAEEAKANFDRIRALHEEGVVSQQAFEAAEARFRATQASYESAIEQARNLAARVENLRAQLEIARENLRDTQLKAPFGGTVRQRLVEIGQYVREQNPMIQIASMNPLRLRASVPEQWFPDVKPGAKVEIEVEAYPGEKFEGRVARVGQAVETATRTFAIEAEFQNSGERLRPGLFARAVLETAHTDQVIRVPAGAVVSFYGVQKVYGVEDGVVREKVVKLGDRFEDQMEITEGLKPGDLIATTELARLQEGVRVQVLKADGGGN